MINRIVNRALVVRDNGVIGEMKVTGGNVTWDINAEIKMSANIDCEGFMTQKTIMTNYGDLIYPSDHTYPGYINPASSTYIGDAFTFNKVRDQIRIVSNVNGVDFILGTFYICACPTTITSTHDTFSLELYDKSFVYNESDVGKRYYIQKGLKYIDVIDALLQRVGGVTLIDKEDSDLTVKDDLEYSADTKILKIINDLLRAIGYRELYFDYLGRAVLRKEDLFNQQISRVYTKGTSQIYPDVKDTFDIYKIPNVFIGMVSKPDGDYMYYKQVNDDPQSLTSTINRGFEITKVYNLDSATVSELHNYIDLMCEESKFLAEKITLSSSIEPNHEYKEKVFVDIDSVKSLFIETSWDISLGIEGKMNHTLVRSY